MTEWIWASCAYRIETNDPEQDVRQLFADVQEARRRFLANGQPEDEDWWEALQIDFPEVDDLIRGWVRGRWERATRDHCAEVLARPFPLEPDDVGVLTRFDATRQYLAVQAPVTETFGRHEVQTLMYTGFRGSVSGGELSSDEVRSLLEQALPSDPEGRDALYLSLESGALLDAAASPLGVSFALDRCVRSLRPDAAPIHDDDEWHRHLGWLRGMGAIR